MTNPRTMTNPLDLDRFVCFSVYAAHHALNRVYKPLLDPLGLTYPQYIVMVALWERDGVAVGDIGDRLGLESNTLTPILKRMETSGLLVRVRDGKDERRVNVRLTDAGRALEAEARRIPGCVLAATGWDEARLGRINQELQALNRSLGTTGA